MHRLRSPNTSILEQLKNLFAPARCMNCLKEDTWFCQRCFDRVPVFPLSCCICNEPNDYGFTCYNCKAKTPLKGVVSAGPYHSPWLRRGIHWLKFKGVTDVASPLAYLLLPRLLIINKLTALQKEALLVPIPLHAKRFRERGFNQSEKIAQVITKIADIPYSNLLTRKKSTFAQSRLPADLRIKNIENSFVLAQTIPSHIKTIILIDDVTTSGSTLTAAAKSINYNLPNVTIWGATIARG